MMGKWIEFIEMTDESKKTKTWIVRNKNKEGNTLGFVKWFGAWRKYCFFPIATSIFEQDCLRDIANFIEERTKEWRTDRKLPKFRKVEKEDCCHYGKTYETPTGN